MNWDWLFTYTDPAIDWDYAMITLVVRFIGVFLVMGVMQVALQVSSRVVRRIESRAEAAPAVAAAMVAATAAEPASTHEVADGLDALTAAAIGLALSLDQRSGSGATIAPVASASAWAAAGRLHQLNRLPR